eukprot:scaffold10622_cov14-Tisochrysis_lutea.AAC.1
MTSLFLELVSDPKDEFESNMTTCTRLQNITKHSICEGAGTIGAVGQLPETENHMGNASSNMSDDL